MSSNVVLCAPVRTPIGAYGGTLKEMAAPALGSIAIAETVKRAGVGLDAIDAVVLGQVVQAGAKMNPARQAAIGAKLPDRVPALTVNRVCGSGAQAIASAAQEIMLGFSHAVVAGGMENMDQAPYVIEKGRWGYRMGDGKLVDAMLHDGLNDAFCNQHSGWVTEDLVSKFQITRDAQDAWAVRSQQNFSAAQAGEYEVGMFLKDASEAVTGLADYRHDIQILVDGKHAANLRDVLSKTEFRKVMAKVKMSPGMAA